MKKSGEAEKVQEEEREDTDLSSLSSQPSNTHFLPVEYFISKANTFLQNFKESLKDKKSKPDWIKQRNDPWGETQRS